MDAMIAGPISLIFFADGRHDCRFPEQRGLPPERQKSLLDLRLVEDMRLGDEAGRRRHFQQQQQRRSLALGPSDDHHRLGVRINSPIFPYRKLIF
jgi:hypothetical protein